MNHAKPTSHTPWHAVQISWGSYHAIIDVIPALAQRYPFMCYRMLAEMDLQHLGKPSGFIHPSI